MSIEIVRNDKGEFMFECRHSQIDEELNELIKKIAEAEKVSKKDQNQSTDEIL